MPIQKKAKIISAKIPTVPRKILFTAVVEFDDQDVAWNAHELEQYLNSPEIIREIVMRFGFLPRFSVNEG